MREVLADTAPAREHVRDRRTVGGRAGDIVEVAIDLPCQRLGGGGDGPAGREALPRVLLYAKFQRYVARAPAELPGLEVRGVHGRGAITQALPDAVPRLAVIENMTATRQHLNLRLGCDAQPGVRGVVRDPRYRVAEGISMPARRARLRI